MSDRETPGQGELFARACTRAWRASVDLLLALEDVRDYGAWEWDSPELNEAHDIIADFGTLRERWLRLAH